MHNADGGARFEWTVAFQEQQGRFRPDRDRLLALAINVRYLLWWGV